MYWYQIGGSLAFSRAMTFGSYRRELKFAITLFLEGFAIALFVLAEFILRVCRISQGVISLVRICSPFTIFGRLCLMWCAVDPCRCFTNFGICFPSGTRKSR